MSVVADDEIYEPSISPVIMGYMDFPPLMENINGEASGTMINLVRKIAEDQKFAVKFVSPPTTRLYHSLARGDVHMWLGSPKTPILAGKVIYLEMPVIITELRLFARRGVKIPPLEMLDQKALIVLNGYQYEDLLENIKQFGRGVRLLPAGHRAVAFDLINKKRADYFLDYTQPNQALLKEYDTRLVRKYNNYFVVSKKAPQPEILLKKLMAGLMRVQGLETTAKAMQ